MTGGQKSTREQLGAVFFAFIMVTSMVAIGGAAFAGTAAAAATDVTGQSASPVDIGQGSTTTDLVYQTTIDGEDSTQTYTLDVSNITSSVDSVSIDDTTTNDVALGGADNGDVSLSGAGAVTDDIGASNEVTVDVTDDDTTGTNAHTFTITLTLTLDTSSSTRTSGIAVPLSSNGNTGTTNLDLQEPVNPTVTATPTRIVNDEITEVSFDIENHPSGAQANFAVDDPSDQVTSGTTSDGSFTFTTDPSGNGDIAVGDSYTIAVDYSSAAEFSGTDSTTVQVAPPLDAAVTYDPSPPEFDGTVQISGQLNNSVDSNGNPTFDSSSFGQLDLIRGNQDANPASANTEATSLRVLSDGTITSNELDIDDAGNYTLVYEDDSSNRFILEGTTIESTGISGADVTATSGGNPVSQISSIQDSSTITLTQPNAASGSNVTRFVLSGVSLDKLDLSNDANAVVEKVTMSDGSSDGAVDSSADGPAISQNIDSDGDNEFDTADNTAGSATLAANTDEATIESVVILATAGTDDNNADVVLNPAESGTLNIESQVEDTTEDTPNVPDVTSNTSIDVPEQQDLNVQTDTQSTPMDSQPDGTRDSFNTVLTVTDSDGEGLKDAADGSLNSNDFDEVTITVTSSNGEFGLNELDTDNDDDPEPNDVDFNNTGDDLTIASATLANDDDVDAETTEFEIEGLRSEQNTTLTFDVSVTTSEGDSFTRTVTTNITNSDTVSDLSLPSDVESGTTADLSLSVTDGVSSTNNRVVVLEKQGGVANGDDLFNVSETSNADVNAIVFNPVEGQVEFDTDGDLTDTPEATRSLSVNNGEYVVEDVTIASAGVDHRLSVREYNTDPTAGALRAQLDNVVTSTGVSAYTITSDVDPVLAGQDEQINLTVTENGNAVNGTELVELAGNTNIDQQGSAVDDVSGPSAVDTDGDSTEDVIQATINADESGTDAVNISTNLNDNSKTGSVCLDVVQPAISTNLTGDLTLGLTSSNVEITAEDPRDGTALQDTDLRLTATNTTYDIDTSDGSNIIADADDDTFDQSRISIADGNNGYVNLDENGTAVLDVSTQENNAGDQPLTLDLAVQNDSASYFGDSPVGVGELSLVNAPNELDPGTDVSQTYQLVDANGDTVDLGTLQISGTGLDGSSQTKVTDEGFVNFDYTTSDSGTIEFKILDSSDVSVNSNDGDGDGTTEFTVKTVSVLEQVNLSLSADQTDVTPGDSVEFNLTREDFDRQTTGTLTIRNASGDTVDAVSIDQTATVTFDEAGEFAVEASKPTRPSVGKSFTNASATISVQVGEGTDEELARFDSGDDGIIDRGEAVDAIVAFNTDGTIGGEEVTRDQAVQVIIAFNEGQTVAA